MGKLSRSLIIMAIGFWALSYSPFFHTNKEKFRLFIIGEIKFPRLSFLLSNIEILTHLFRPITLTARLWVNIWVGHLLIRALSSFYLNCLVSSTHVSTGFRLLTGFFFFERGIIFLQAFVFRYLISVYWKENLEHSLTEWK
jgi:F0F1-type ATP synthase membrane subunit a